ncbi:DMT family transporter [Amycolatopsis rhabdoformis]|uniref:DMT family transporter n=1 Tax=Amycolatopsis rhabdoformis TaxID=1448059 RepID=A0ABZ1HWI2_9PSEU|nr:DMT family transporter [Amycolatopsis rhabdoformis]WSE26229.1 DMT family transporter [Amycolatopsis rhabdoformis]
MTEKPDGGVAPYSYLLVTMALFGAAFTSSKVVVGELPHDVAACLRFGGGALILVVLLCVRPGTARFSWRDLVKAGLVGLVGVFAYNFFFFWGLSLAPAIDGSIIVPVLSPVLTTVYFLATGKETASRARIFGLASGIVGAVVFFVGIGGGDAGFSGSRLAGDFVYLAGAACWAAYSIASKKVLSGMEPLRATTYATGVGALALVVVAVPSFAGTEWTSVSTLTWANLAFLAIGPTAVAYLFYYRGLRAVSPVTATITMFAVPVFGTVTSVVFLHESFTAGQVAGAVITVVGAVLAVTQGKISTTERKKVHR